MSRKTSSVVFHRDGRISGDALSIAARLTEQASVEIGLRGIGPDATTRDVHNARASVLLGRVKRYMSAAKCVGNGPRETR